MTTATSTHRAELDRLAKLFRSLAANMQRGLLPSIQHFGFAVGKLVSEIVRLIGELDLSEVRTREFMRLFTSALKDTREAAEREDTVTVADIIEFEIAPLLEGLQTTGT